MNKPIIGKALEYIITFFIILTLNFMVPRLMPGDPFTFLSNDEVGVSFTFTEEEIKKYKDYYGLNKPITTQYVDYLKNTLSGYLGYSIFYNDEVLNIITERITWTISLVFISTLISAFSGSLLGSISAYYRHRKIDKVLYFFFVSISQIPPFLIGLLILYYFGAYLKLFPLSGGITPFMEYNSYWHKIIDLAYHFILPALTLSFVNIGNFYLVSRNSVIEILSKDYITTAKAKALKKRRIVFVHALRNAIFPIVTRIFLSFGTVIGGAVLIENVFNYPGLGLLMKEAVFYRDYPLIQGIFTIMALFVLTMNLLSDLINKKLDPRLS
ncbi:ABC transporter permease [Thermohalobacter berrensis]|uniref:ABC transporter permease n=1 Tax=Thermohalobacter berrensis TaxID=99594 RepID=A0A419T8K8_9FIRM|nr:ABC transporter permease [Thermohalobacter berrensis]RKD33792.1 ABC transporter permease [Thermohalobacter berrensis]